MPAEGGDGRRPVPAVDLRPTSAKLHHLTGSPSRLDQAHRRGPDDISLTDPWPPVGERHRMVPAERPRMVMADGGWGAATGPPATAEAVYGRVDRVADRLGCESAAALGADDVLVLRRVGPTRWTHLGGCGRGERWAGIVELDSETDERLNQALPRGRSVRQHGAEAHHVLGPYWAATSVLVRVDDDHAVVLGSEYGSTLLRDASDDDVTRVAREAADAVSSVSPVKHLADEVEVMSAVRTLTASAPSGAVDLMHHTAQTIASTMGCELVALWVEPGRFVVVQRGWSMPGSADDLAQVMASLVGQTPRTIVVQDAAERPLAHPVGGPAGVVSYILRPLRPDGRSACVLVANAAPSPRGFTDLCQRLLHGLCESAELLLGNALVREDLEKALDSSRRHARIDPLTGTANRRGWTEAIERLRPEVDRGVPVTVVAVDLDGLKYVNDTMGHHGGDELIVACARALQKVIRGRDVVARLGGDEFGLLMPGVQSAPQLIARRLRRSLDGVVSPAGVALRTSIGAATCPPRGRIEDAWAEADQVMYEDKRSRRSAR